MSGAGPLWLVAQFPAPLKGAPEGAAPPLCGLRARCPLRQRAAVPVVLPCRAEDLTHCEVRRLPGGRDLRRCHPDR